MERFNLWKLNDVEDYEQYETKKWNKFRTMKNLDVVDDDDDDEIVTAERIRQNMNFQLGHYDSTGHKTQSDEECTQLLKQMMRT